MAPRTPAEKMLAKIWSEVLRLEKVGIHDNFFDLGGHSLLAAKVISRVREAFQVTVPLRTLFEKPTVAELAAQIAPVARSQEIQHLLADLEMLSDEEAERLLAQEISNND